MMSLKRIFGLMLLFLLFETVVAVATVLWFPTSNVLLACAAMTALALAVWLCVVLITRLLTKQRAAPVPVERPVVPQKQMVEDSFTQELKGLITEANRRLEGLLPATNRGPQPTVATLPLYLVIGPEGVGKTALMLNSGLEPRLLAGDATRDGATAPTRLANLWLAEGAIFAEISGRVLTQDPDRWDKALRLLSEQRPISLWRRIVRGTPSGADLRGVLLACDTGQFLRSHELERLGPLARTLNERLATINSVYRKEFPVYVLLTHCDAVQYFPEFFAHLSEAESRRPLGAVLQISQSQAESADQYSDREGRRLAGYFNRLYQSLADKRMNLLAREEDTDKRALAYEFPRELKKLRGDVVQFLLDSFRPAALDPGFRLRGFFFFGRRMVARGDAALEPVTVTETIVRRPAEATVMFGSQSETSQRDGSSMVRRTYSAAVPRWTFLTEVMRDLILEDPAGRMAPVVATPETTYRTLAFAGAGAICLLFSLIWVNSWRKNYTLLNGVEAAVAATPLVAPPEGPAAVADLEPVRAVLDPLHGRSAPGLSYRWGLYTGKPVRDELDRLYFSRFRSAMLNPLLMTMTQRMGSLNPALPQGTDVNGLVKSYRSMTSRACSPDPAVLNATVYPLWRTLATPDPSMSALADRQIGFYLAELVAADPYQRLGDAIPEDHLAVAHAQSYLRNLGGPEKLFHALVNEINSKGVPDRLSDFAGDYTQVLSGPNVVEPAYTAQGWATLQENLHSHKLVAAGDPCVVGNDERVTPWGSDSATEARVNQLYTEEYVQHWESFLNAHHVLPFNSTVDASQKLRVLADNNRSPLLALVYVTSANTNVAPPQSVADQMSHDLRGVVDSTHRRAVQAFDKFGGKSTAPAPVTGAVPAAPPSTVLSEFSPVRAMVDPGSRDKWLNDKNAGYMKSLEELSTALAALPPHVDSSVPTDVAALEHAKASVVNANLALHTLEGFFPNTPQGVDVTLRNLLREPIDYADRTVREVRVEKPPPVVATGLAAPSSAPPPPPPGPSPHDLAKPTIAAINASERDLCNAISSVDAKYPFDGTATQEATVDDLDGVFSIGTGALTRFSTSPDVSKAYAHQGKLWTAKPDFPATFSQPFLNELNGLEQMSDALYGDGSSHPHVEYTITLDGTGNIPFELEVGGHVIKYKPGKPGIPTRLDWPPISNAPTRLLAHTGKGGPGLPAETTGLWSLHHLLQVANNQSGNVFTFSAIEFAHSRIPLMNEKGAPGTLQIRVDSPAGNFFGRDYFSHLRCESSWAVH